MTAECNPEPQIDERVVLLQWGRDQMTAECTIVEDHALVLTPASMGPRSDDRGMEPQCKEKHVRDEASMGPRSDDRGMDVVLYETEQCQTPLQWGRDQMTAEWIPFSDEPSRDTELQWGRDQM